MNTSSDKHLILPASLRTDILSYDETLDYWKVLDGKSNDKKIILRSLIHRNIINILPIYTPNRLDCVRVSQEPFTAYFKPQIKGGFLCMNDNGDSDWLSADMIGLIATIRSFQVYSQKNKDFVLNQVMHSILKDVSSEFKRLASVRHQDKAVDIKAIHNALQRWIK